MEPPTPNVCNFAEASPPKATPNNLAQLYPQRGLLCGAGRLADGMLILSLGKLKPKMSCSCFTTRRRGHCHSYAVRHVENILRFEVLEQQAPQPESSSKPLRPLKAGRSCPNGHAPVRRPLLHKESLSNGDARTAIDEGNVSVEWSVFSLAPLALVMGRTAHSETKTVPGWP